MKVTQIISSKDRPAQCDLLIRSTLEKFSACKNIFVIWKASNNDFLEGYNRLVKKYDDYNIGFFIEREFRSDLISLVIASEDDYILMNSDDNVFCHTIGYLPEKLLDNQIAFSLRLGMGINYCLPAKLEMVEPEYHRVYGNYIIWDWTKCDPRTCYGYPQPYDSNIYHKDWLFKKLQSGKFTNPYTLENFMNNNRDIEKRYMIAFKQPKLISIMANTTGQNDNPNMQGDGQSVAELNDKWLNGYQISMPEIEENIQCHIYGKYEFEKCE